MKKASEVKGKAGIGIVLSARKERLMLIQAADTVNSLLIAHHIGGPENLQRFNAVVSQVLQEYLNKEFPVSPEDLGRTFINGIKPK